MPDDRQPADRPVHHIKNPPKRRILACQKSILSIGMHTIHVTARIKQHLQRKCIKSQDRCLTFYTLREKKFLHRNFLLVHVWRSPNIDCRKNEVFRQSQIRPKGGFFHMQLHLALPHAGRQKAPSCFSMGYCSQLGFSRIRTPAAIPSAAYIVTTEVPP